MIARYVKVVQDENGVINIEAQAENPLMLVGLLESAKAEVVRQAASEKTPLVEAAPGPLRNNFPRR